MSRAARERAAATGELPHEFLLRVSRGEEVDGHKPSFSERVDAAKVAAPYFAPRLASMAVERPREPFEVPAFRDPAELSTPDLLRSALGQLSTSERHWEALVSDPVLGPALSQYLIRLAERGRE